MRKISNAFLLIAIASSYITAPTVQQPAMAQMAENWNVVPHQRAEIKNSTGLTLLNKRQVEAACEMFRKATVEDPSSPVPYGSLGVGLAMQGRYQEALDALQKSYQLKQSGETLLTTGIVYYLMHDYDAAINAWNKVLEANPKAGHVLGDIGFAFLRKGDFNQAEQFFDKLVKYSPHSEFGYYGLALTKYLKGEFRAARASAERAELIYSYPPAILLLARLDYVEGDRARAIKRIQQYAQLVRKPNWQGRPMAEIGYPAQHDAHWDPYLEDILENANVFLSETLDLPKQDSRRASLANQAKLSAKIDVIKKQLAEHPNDLMLTRQLGILQLANGEYSSAAHAFETVLQVCPDCHIALLLEATALARDGKNAQAASLIDRFKQAHPNESIAPAILALGQAEPTESNPPPKQKPTKPAVKPTRTPKPKPAEKASPAPVAQPEAQPEAKPEAASPTPAVQPEPAPPAPAVQPEAAPATKATPAPTSPPAPTGPTIPASEF